MTSSGSTRRYADAPVRTRATGSRRARPGRRTLALGEALVDAVAVGLVGNDEHPAVGRAAVAASRDRQVKTADRNRMLNRINERKPANVRTDKPERLRMINHGGGRLAAEWSVASTRCKSALWSSLTPSPGLAHGAFHERSPRHLQHLPRDYELAIRWLRPSFLTRDHWTPGRKGRDIHGIATSTTR